LIAQYDPHTVVLRDHDGHLAVLERDAGDHPRPVTPGSITVFTSGTTGDPKGVVLGRSALVGNATKTAELHGFGHGRPHGTCLEMFHVNALVMSLVGTILTEEVLVTDYTGDPASYFRRLEAAGARTGSVNPVVLRRIVDEHPPWPKGLDYLITAAGPCGKNLATEFYGLYGPRLRQGYGLSEAVNFSFVMPRVDDPATFEALYLAGRPPVGQPLRDTHYEIVGGELVIRTPDRMSGYLNSPATEEMSGPLSTGDFAEVREGLVVLLGRVAEQLTVPGLEPAPGRAEDALDLPVPAGDYAVVQVPGRPQVALFTSRRISGDVQAVIDRSPLPLAVVEGGSLRLSLSGKVQRITMSEQAGALMRDVRAALDDPDTAAGNQRLVLALGVSGSPLGAQKLRAPEALECGCHLSGSLALILVRSQPSCAVPHAAAAWQRSGKPWLIAVTHRSLPVDPSAELVRRVHSGSHTVSLLERRP